MDLRQRIEQAFENRAVLVPGAAPRELLAAIDECLELLGSGCARVAEPDGAGWRVNERLKKAVLLHFRTHENVVQESGPFRWYDKVPLRHSGHDAARFAAEGARIVPGAIVRAGAYVAQNAVVMPSFINVGAWVGEGTMVDTWATVGSCAQVGRNVHLSGGVGIGGVLEPLQARPTIIEDDCFIGARSEVVEGVIVGEGSVLAMGVFITQSTKIVNRQTGEIIYGHVPPFSVIVPGTLPDPKGGPSLACAVIVKTVDAKTREKTAVNELLRD